MIPSVERIVQAVGFLGRRFRWRWPTNVAGLREAIAEAEVLAAGREEDEPAALLYALLRRPNDLGDAWPLLAILLAENHAAELGRALRLQEDDALRSLRMRIIARDPDRRAGFSEVRNFVSARMSPAE
jgi:hypothetical protein